MTRENVFCLQKKRPKRKSTSEPVDVSKAHPLSVKLTFKLKSMSKQQLVFKQCTTGFSYFLSLTEVGNFELLLSYLPNFCAVCVLVTVATMEDHTHHGSAHLDKLNLLSSLFEGDTGRVSPNIVVSCNIRRHGGDVFSAAVKRYGFPYKWVQSLCGISGLTTGTGGEGGGGGEGGEWGEGTVKLQVETSVETMAAVMTALRKRLKAQVNLAKQISKLGEEKPLHWCSTMSYILQHHTPILRFGIQHHTYIAVQCIYHMHTEVVCCHST